METTDKVLKLLRNCNCWAKIRIMHVLKVQKTIALSGSGDAISNNYLLILVLFGSEINEDRGSGRTLIFSPQFPVRKWNVYHDSRMKN